MHVAGVTLSFGLTVRVMTLILTFCLGSIVVDFLRRAVRGFGPNDVSYGEPRRPWAVGL